MAYLTNSEQDIADMLDAIGVEDFEALIKNIPAKLRFKKDFELPEAESEFGTRSITEKLASKNELYTSYLGGGTYDHYVPAVVSEITSRPEFYTSYTPYQPEVSQGNLQAMYEFQSQICALTEMDVTNASMYEAGSALAEAVLLAAAHTRLKKILVPDTLNPNYREIVQTYVEYLDIELVFVKADMLQMDAADLENKFTDDIAAVIVQHPNYYGFLEDVDRVNQLRENKKTLLIQVYDPISLGVLKTPGAFRADIAIAEGQSLGNAQNYGGPFVGLFSVNQKLVRKIPGRISGITKDAEGKRGFVLTLQTREQHIRRENATSNICTNSGLLTVAVGTYLATMGKKGMQEVANLCMQKAHYLADQLCKIPGVKLATDGSFFKEFTLELPCAADDLIQKALEEKIFAGISLRKQGKPNHILIAVTEKRTREELDTFVTVVKSILK